MADLVQTPANVAPGSGVVPITIRAVSSAAVVAGNPVYLDPSSGQWGPALSSGTAKQSGQYGCGIALDSAPGSQQYFTVQTGGQVNLGATLTIGQTYVVSANSGAIAPVSDLATGNYVTILGVAISASILMMCGGGPLASGVQHA